MIALRNNNNLHTYEVFFFTSTTKLAIPCLDNVNEDNGIK